MMFRNGNFARLALPLFCCVLLAVGMQAQEKAKTGAQSKSLQARPVDPAEQAFQSAQTFQIAGDYEKAGAAYREAIAGALQQLGNLRVSHREYSQGIDLLTQAVNIAPKQPAIRIDLAIADFDTNDFEKARTDIEGALQQDPRDVRALSLAGRIYFMLGEFQGAAERLESSLRQQPDFDTAYLLALANLKLKKPTAASIIFDEMLASDKPDASTHALIGLAYRETGYFEQSASHFSKAIELEPKKPHIHSALGLTYFLHGVPNYSKAREQFLAELSMTPDDYTSLYYLGMIATNEKKPSEAEKWFRQAAATHPEEPGPGEPQKLGPSRPQELPSLLLQAPHKAETPNAGEAEYIKRVSSLLGEAYHNLGVIDARASRYGEAADEFAEASRWNPNIDKLDHNWGLAAFRAQRYDQAIVPLEREIRKTPGDAAVRQMLGLSYYMTDQFAKSAETFRPILEQLPDNPGLLYAAGQALLRSGDSAAGGKILSRMVERGSGTPEVHLMIGQAYYEQAKFPDALAEFHQALEMNPRLPEAHYSTGIIFVKQGKLDEAAQEFNAELALDSKSVPAMYQLAYVKLQQRETEEAIRLLNDVLGQRPSYGDAHYQLGKALLDQGDASGAIHHLEAATRLQPSQSYGYYQLSLAYRRAGRVEEAEKALHTYQELKDKSPRKASGEGPRK